MNETFAKTSLVAVARAGDVAILWLSDAARRNALSTVLVREIVDALDSTRRDGVRAVVIASSEKTFCAGADIRDMLENGWLDAAPGGDALITPPELFERLESDPRIIVAAVDGLALGGGVELCLACDLVVAGPKASFMFPELALGVLPNTAIGKLPSIVGQRRAAELILTRRRIDVNEAYALGLVTNLAGEQSAIDRAVFLTQEICSTTPPTVLTAAKRRLSRGASWDAIHGMLADMDPAEWREGTTAFLEKRRPNYGPFWSPSTDLKESH